MGDLLELPARLLFSPSSSFNMTRHNTQLAPIVGENFKPLVRLD